MSMTPLRPCPCCGSYPVTHSVELRAEEGKALEVISCAIRGLSLRSSVLRSGNLAAYWNTRAVTDALLRAAIPVITVAASALKEAGIDPTGEHSLLRKIHAHLSDAP